MNVQKILSNKFIYFWATSIFSDGIKLKNVTLTPPISAGSEDPLPDVAPPLVNDSVNRLTSAAKTACNKLNRS